MEFYKINETSFKNSQEKEFKILFEFIRDNNINKLPLGKIEIDGDRIFLMNVETSGNDESIQPLEMHRKYIDVHILIDGKEKIGWKATSDINHLLKQYEEDGDCALSDDKPQFYVILEPGDCFVAYPEDAHAPAIGDGKIRKLIGKIKI